MTRVNFAEAFGNNIRFQFGGINPFKEFTCDLFCNVFVSGFIRNRANEKKFKRFQDMKVMVQDARIHEEALFLRF
jgi:hypothetical protein